MEINYLVLLIAVPLIISFINIILPSFAGKLLTLLGLLFSSFIVYQLYVIQFETASYFNMLILSADKLSLFTLAFIQLLSLIILLFSLKGVPKEIEKRFFILYPMTVAFCNGVLLSHNFIAFLIFWGMSGATLYLFNLLGNTPDTPKSAKKTFIIIGGSDAFLIMGLVLIVFLAPSAGGGFLSSKLPLTGELSHIAFVFLLIAAFAKAGGFPFHTWVPEFAKDSPVESAAFLPASLDKFLGIYLLARMVTSIFVFGYHINLIIITLGSLTVITAVMMAMNQHNGKKLLGYHAVSQVGYMIMGVGSGSILAFAGGLFHMVNHTIYKSSLFLSIGSVEKKAGTDELDELGGLAKKMPLTFLVAMIASFSISGIPPLNGFFSKWMIYQGLIEELKTHSPVVQIWLLVCIILALFGSALTLASFMKFLHTVFLGKIQEKYLGLSDAPFNQKLAGILLALLCIIFGIFAVQIPLTRFIYPALSDLGMTLPVFPGLYDPLLLLMLFLIVFIIGIGLYFVKAKVRYDNVYLGGSLPLEKFRIAGTEFYNEVRNMTPLKTIFNWAEKKYFDVYELSYKFTFGFSEVLQKGHPGQLQLYIMFILIGVLIFLLLI